MPEQLTPATPVIYASSEKSHEDALTFARSNNFSFSESEPETSCIAIEFAEEQITLHDIAHKTTLNIDFISGGLAHRVQFGGGQGQTIAKAMGIKKGNKPHILDATAGLARDAWVLANLGCRMTLCEQSPILSTMISRAIECAREEKEFEPLFEQGFELHHQNAIELLNSEIISDIDVIYLDPMYPERKKSALVKKDMQILHQLIGHASDEHNKELLNTALKYARQRVVVKRPKGAPYLSELKPTLDYQSKKTRYDVYVISAIKTSN